MFCGQEEATCQIQTFNNCEHQVPNALSAAQCVLEQGELKRLQKPVGCAAIVKVLETLRWEKWADLSGRHDDWAWDTALWLGRRMGRLRLSELGGLAGGIGLCRDEASYQALWRT